MMLGLRSASHASAARRACLRRGRLSAVPRGWRRTRGVWQRARRITGGLVGIHGAGARDMPRGTQRDSRRDRCDTRAAPGARRRARSRGGRRARPGSGIGPPAARRRDRRRDGAGVSERLLF